MEFGSFFGLGVDAMQMERLKANWTRVNDNNIPRTADPPPPDHHKIRRENMLLLIEYIIFNCENLEAHLFDEGRRCPRSIAHNSNHPHRLLHEA